MTALEAMDPQWQPYTDAATASHRFEQASSAGHAPSNRDYPALAQPPSHAQSASHQAQAQAQAHAHAQTHQLQYQNAQAPPTATYGYDHYTTAAQHPHPHPPSLPSLSLSPLPPANTSQSRDASGDVAMQDVNDSHAGIKYAMRPHHQHHLSGGGRPQSLHSPQEPSSAAQRYSPMEALSPTSPYAPKSAITNPGHVPGQYQTQSPTRHHDYHSQSQSQSPYNANASRSAAHQHQQQQIPGMMPYSQHDAYQTSPPSHLLDSPYGSDSVKSPRRPAPPKRLVPEFSTVRSPADLRPKVNTQPPFRRAAPEGGFISVC
ncbi:hypothetical protein IMZ48_42860 [Candidatus Bathyarchaeota archaeon]|nr:hypothetical protein [Candidatus Bathyarchaeota archaeon]